MSDLKSIVLAPVAVIKRHFMYLCCFITNITALKDEVRCLNAATNELQLRVDIASNNAVAIKPEVVNWLIDSKNFEEEADIILNEVPKVRGGCLRVATRYILSRRAKMTMENMKLHREKSMLLVLGSTYEFNGHKQIEQDIMTTLNVNEEKTLGICGMGGIGKTTMAKRIMNKLLEENVFQEVVMVNVSECVNEVKIQAEIGGVLGLRNLEMETPQTRAQKLQERLISDTNRTLLVLDDVWESLRLNELGIPCEGDSQGCTILITSRNSDVLMAMNVENIFLMKALSEEDAWFCFRNAVGACVDDIELEPIAKQIVRKCGGLPIALAVICQALRDEKSLSIWKDTLKILSNPNPKNTPNFISDIYNPFIVSYDGLEYDVKLVLLLCGLFPEDSDIRLEYLTYFCMGLCIFEESIFNMDEARDRMTILIMKLKSQSLLLDGEEEDCVRMHDIVRDVCIFIAKKEGYIGGQDCTWMLSCSRWTKPGLVFPNLKLLYMISDSVEGGEFKMDDTFFLGMRDLNVLSIENYSWTSLPHTTQLLKNIRTLLLVSCPDLDSISVVCDLVNLEILICRGCGSIEELPLEIMRLFRLKLLELSECHKLQSIGPGVPKNLKELRLKSLPALKHLRQFDTPPSQMNVVSIFNQLSCIYIYGCHELCNLFSLSAMTTASGSCLSLLERIVIESCGMMEQVFMWNEESGKQMISIDIPQLFPKLKVLILDSLPRLTTICQGTKSLEFPVLAQMKISRCPLLEIFVSIGGRSPEKHDDQSHTLAIAGKSCISHLQILSIEECEMIEHVFVHKNQRNVDIKTLVFSELKSLSLKSLPGLSGLCKGIKSFEFPLLDHIQIKECPQLESIHTISLFNKPDKVAMEFWKNQPFKTSEYLSLEGDAKRNLDFRVAQNMRCLSFRECERGAKLVNMTTMVDLFPRLEVLRLLKLTELQEIWNIDDDGSIPNTFLKNLKELRLEFLPALNRLWKSSNSTYVVSIFSQLSSIYIYGCHSLRSLLELPGMTTGSCTFQLKKLMIASCDMMEQVFLCTEGENQISLHFPKLKVLILDSLPKLTSLSKGTKISDLHLLDRKRISRCPLLEIYDTPYQDDRAGDDDSVHLFCKPYNKVQEKMELRVQGNISVGKDIEECVEYMSFEGDGSRILDVGQVAQSMRCLTFRECSMNIATIATVFPLLEVMWLVDITNLEEICDIDVLENLKELRLKSLPALKHLRQFDTTPSQINVVSIFEKLSCIYIYGCHGLCNLFSLSAMTTASGSCLPLLERLVIERCDTMEQVFFWNEEERNNDITLVFPKLEFLSLRSLPMLTCFCKGNGSLEFPLLARMRITRCPLLVLGNFVSDDESPDDHDDSIHSIRKPDKKKIEFWISELYKKITNLSVEGDVDSQLEQNMHRLSFKECSTGMKLVNMAEIATVFPLLEVLQLVRLQAQKHLWQSSSSPSQMIVASIFNQLSSIYIFGCKELSNLFSLSMTERGSCILQLEKLEIESCEMMEQVFLWNEESEKPRSIDVGEFPKLNFLRLSFLPRLTDFCSGIKRIKCPLLTDVKIVNCSKLRSSVYLNGKHSAIFNSSKSVQHQRAKDTNSAMQLHRPRTEEKGKRRLEDSSNEIKML